MSNTRLCRYLLTTILSLSLMCLATFAYTNEFPREQAIEVELTDVNWQNDWNQPLLVSCDPLEALYWVRSEYSSSYEDRQWRWDCKEVGPTCK